MNGPSVHPALLQEQIAGGVRCLTCERRCELGEGQRGWCRTRQNHGGRLRTLTYGAVSALSCNPIEKKPLHHFYPGTLALTVGSWSCNATCAWCQNHRLSRNVPDNSDLVSPREFVRLAWAYGCQGTSLSFNEPTLSLEWALDLFPHAREAGLYNTFVTNGTMTETALRMLAEDGLDAMSIDIKGDAEAVRRHCRLDAEVVWRNCRLARKLGVWVELVTLVVPGVNDDPDVLGGIARRIVDELGAGTPWHLNRYFSAHRFSVPPTPEQTLVRARAIGRQAGLRFVYIGNLGNAESGHTDCPSCGTRLVSRDRLRLHRSDVTAGGSCPHCGEAIEGVGWGWRGEADKVVRFRALHSVD